MMGTKYSSVFVERARLARLGADEVARQAIIMKTPAQVRADIPRDTAAGMRYSDAVELHGMEAADPKELQNDIDPIRAAALPYGSPCKIRGMHH